MSQAAVPQQPIVVVSSGGPNILIRLVWFVLVGWWLGGLVSLLAWFCFVTVLGIPLGLYVVNRLPSVITLRPQEQTWRMENGVLRRGGVQRPFWLRALYFIAVGWWFSGAWIAIAYLSLLTIILIPLSFWMYGRIGAVTTLYKS